MRVCLFEDGRALDLEPLSLSRPVFDLRCGLGPLADKQVRHFGKPAADGVLVRPALAPLCTSRQPHVIVNDLHWLRAGPTVLVNGRWLPPGGTIERPNSLLADGPFVATCGEEVAYAVLPPEELVDCMPGTIDPCLAAWKHALPRRPAGGRMARFLWELVDWNGEQIAADFDELPPAEDAICRPANLALVGPSDRLRVDPSARVDPFAIADTTRGPVVIDREAVILPFTRLEGPCYVGPLTQIFAAHVRAGTTIGPNCRVGGEVEASILQGNANKYHDGFLGHSYLGEWVNFGAGTHTSDLRFDYGEVVLTVNGDPTPTGRGKVGAFVGDHAKTGIGTLLNTGSNVGVFCQLLPSGGLLPRFVPSFCRFGNGRLTDELELADLFATAEKVAQRRGEAFTEAHRALFRGLHDRTAALRRHALREAEQRRLRRSA